MRTYGWDKEGKYFETHKDDISISELVGQTLTAVEVGDDTVWEVKIGEV